jgi:hypothetical protein
MKYVQSKHLALVDPLRAVLEQDYFLRLVYECEGNYIRDLKRMNQGLPPLVDEKPLPPPKTPYENLMAASNDEYLI